jgi:hypothetical protein
MNELKAKSILDNVKAKIIELINGMTFIHSLHVVIFTASTVRQTRSGIMVTFKQTEVPCRGRVNDREHQELLKRVREKDEIIRSLQEEIAQLRKRRCVREAEEELSA